MTGMTETTPTPTPTKITNANQRRALQNAPQNALQDAQRRQNATLLANRYP